MRTSVHVSVYTHSLNYVSDRMLRSIHQIIAASGLDVSIFIDQWAVVDRGLTTWMRTRDLQSVHLEIYDSDTDQLVTRWDLNVLYEAGGEDGGFHEDPEAILSAIVKAGHVPARCRYRILATTKEGRPDVEGWSTTSARSVDGMVRQSVGTAVASPDIQATAGYWRKP